MPARPIFYALFVPFSLVAFFAVPPATIYFTCNRFAPGAYGKFAHVVEAKYNTTRNSTLMDWLPAPLADLMASQRATETGDGTNDAGARVASPGGGAQPQGQPQARAEDTAGAGAGDGTDAQSVAIEVDAASGATRAAPRTSEAGGGAPAGAEAGSGTEAERVAEGLGVTRSNGEEVVLFRPGAAVWRVRDGPKPHINSGETVLYAFEDVPREMAAGSADKPPVYLRPERLPGAACPVGGGSAFTLSRPLQAWMCCANHYGDSRRPQPGEQGIAWTALDGTWPIKGHAEKPCTYFRALLAAGKYNLCCMDSWGTGVVLNEP